MIEGRAETLEEWYQILQETVDKYNVLIDSLIFPEDTESDEYVVYKKKVSMYLEAQKLSKYYLDQRN